MTDQRANVTLFTISESTMPACTPDGYCAICADEGIPGRVLQLLPDDMALLAMAADEPQEVAIDLIDDVKVGDRLLVHLGFAIARLEDEV